MANSKSATKRIRQSERALERNRAQRSRLKTALKRVMTSQDAETATDAYRQAAALLDRFASRNLLHRNKAARKKSQLAKLVVSKGGQA